MDADIAALALPLCDLTPFAAEGVRAELSVVRVTGVAGGTELVGGRPEVGHYVSVGSEIRVHIPEDPSSARAVLALAFKEAAWAQGGLLLHASAVAFGERAAVAIAPSEGGKSTLARLCREAGAALLSDELVAVLPDGTVWGTPFWSEPDLVCTRLQAALGGVVLLAKGDRERIDSVPAVEAVAALAAQTLEFGHGEVPRGELLRRLGGLSQAPGIHRLTFRQDPAVGPFLAAWLDERRRNQDA